MEGSQRKKLGAADLPRQIFTCRAIVHASAYQFTKFQPPSSISFGDTEGVPK